MQKNETCANVYVLFFLTFMHKESLVNYTSFCIGADCISPNLIKMCYGGLVARTLALLVDCTRCNSVFYPGSHQTFMVRSCEWQHISLQRAHKAYSTALSHPGVKYHPVTHRLNRID